MFPAHKEFWVQVLRNPTIKGNAKQRAASEQHRVAKTYLFNSLITHLDPQSALSLIPAPSPTTMADCPAV